MICNTTSNMRNIIFIAAGLLFCMYGCGRSASYRQTAEVIDTFAHKIRCDKPEKLPIEVLDPTAIIASDSLLAILVRHENKVFRIYDKETLALKGTVLSKGKGPNEVHMLNRINQWDTRNGEFRVLIQSYPFFLGWLDIRQSLDSETTIFPVKYNFTGNIDEQTLLSSSNVVFDRGNDDLIMNKDPERSNTIKSDPNPFFLIYNYRSKKSYDTTYLKTLHAVPEMSSYHSLIYSGYSSISPTADTWARAFTFLGTVDFYNLRNKKQIRVCLSPDVLDYQNALKRPKEHFKESVATQDYYFVLSASDATDNCKIYMFDWNGQPLCELQFTTPIRFFSVNQDSMELYAIDRNESILRYDIRHAFRSAQNDRTGNSPEIDRNLSL